MPKKIDREARRQQIVRTYLKIAARDGLETTTSRAVAAELGVSTGSLWHYFSGFDEVVLRAFQLIFDRTNARISEGVAQHTGLHALMEMLEETLPVGPETQREAFVVVNFWGRASSRPDLAQFQTQVAAQWRRQILTHLGEAADQGELSAGAPVESVADVLMVLITGFQVECALQTTLASAQRQWQTVHHCLSAWLTDAGQETIQLASADSPSSADR
ncbi:TetR/AcrR family transcriptional regulator [Nesterenkonia lutea]|uniref:AcrR family transcriptional regulator n=1 Tax=Nesterenkonia lutea TaxID=272919 RepID=A0ABR9JDD5_9MICC|nr:TetR family transcriptional regulator C-terminal domain-containing protein [Nesterenkonia lutea]MBE1523938.1 AcrR family transcriptional regulator [Nesterenkonia lutea]